MRIEDLNAFEGEYWVRQSNYEYRSFNGELYICPVHNAKPDFYNPFTAKYEVVVRLLNIGAKTKDESLPRRDLEEMVLDFVRRNGLLGLAVYYPQNIDLLQDDYALLSKGNNITGKQLIKVEEYIKLFLPFVIDNDIKINHDEQNHISFELEKEKGLELLGEKSPIYDMIYSRYYCEKLDWILEYAENLYEFYFAVANFKNADSIEEKKLYAKRIGSFSVKGFCMDLKLGDDVNIVYKCNTLAMTVDVLFELLVAGELNLIKVCKHDGVVFYATNPKAEFCSPKCRNQFNVYKSREKKVE